MVIGTRVDRADQGHAIRAVVEIDDSELEFAVGTAYDSHCIICRTRDANHPAGFQKRLGHGLLDHRIKG